MLLIIYRQPATNTLMQIGWEVGTPSPFKGAEQLIFTTGEVRASGAELAWIKVMFKNLPEFNGQQVSYYGDFAKFIAGNLPV